MLDTIKEQISETRDRQAVMILLQSLDVPLAVLKIKSAAVSGELWVANGKQLCFGKVEPDSDGPLIDMLRLLAVTEGDFTLEVSDKKVAPCQVSITIAEVVADEQAVVRKIKNVLWPVDESPVKEAQQADKTKAGPASLPESRTHFSSQDEADYMSAVTVEIPAFKRADAEPVFADSLMSPAGNLIDQPSETKGGINVSESKAETVELAKPPLKEAQAQPEPEPQAAKDEISALGNLFDDDTRTVDLGAEQATDTIDLSPTTGESADTIDPGAGESAPKADESEPAVDTRGEEDLLDQKRREHLALAQMLSDASDAFHEESEPSKDDLAEQRQAEVDAALSEAADAAEKFSAAPLPDPTQTDANLKAKRRADYEALKMFYGEEPEKFYETTAKPSDTQPQIGLSEFKKRILDLASSELRNPEEFADRDPQLAQDREGTRAILSPELEAPPPSQEAGQPPPAPFVAQDVESPYGAMASDVARREALKEKLTVSPRADYLGLFSRMKLPGAVAVAVESARRRNTLSAKVVGLSIAAAVSIPLFTYIVWHQFDAQAQEEMNQRREAAELAERSIEQKSVVEKPEEPFRMPAGNVSQGSSSGKSGGSDAQSASGKGLTIDERNQKFDWKPPTGAVPLRMDQIADATIGMKNADNMATTGFNDRALTAYIELIRKYPTFALLRVKAARLCIQNHQYRQAYQICVTGLQGCQTRSDFDMLTAVIKEIP